MIIDPASAAPSEVYKVMIGAIVPRPIAFVSTVSPEGIRNLAPFSFFTGISANPPSNKYFGFRPAAKEKAVSHYYRTFMLGLQLG